MLIKKKMEIKSVSGETIYLVRADSWKEAFQIALKNKISFTNADFTGKDLSVLDLSGSDFRGAKFESADLRGTKMRGCNFDGADLRGIKVNNATDFEKSTLRGVNLDGVKLSEPEKAPEVNNPSQNAVAGIAGKPPEFHGCNFRGAILDGASMVGCDLRGCDLRGTKMRGCNLDNADLRGIKVDKATDFSKSTLRGAKFDGVNLTGPEKAPEVNNQSPGAAAGATGGGAKYHVPDVPASLNEKMHEMGGKWDNEKKCWYFTDPGKARETEQLANDERAKSPNKSSGASVIHAVVKEVTHEL